MNKKIISCGKWLQKFENKIVIYGAGKWGKRLYEEAYMYVKQENLYICDKTTKIIEGGGKLFLI